MNLTDAIAFLEEMVPDPSLGLPEELFLYLTKTTPMVNVDLLIKDEKGRTLLSWRNDALSGAGWHVPGGIVRFKETFEARVKKVAETEIGANVDFEPSPIAMNEGIRRDRQIRGHFISFLYKCSLSSTFVPRNEGLSCDDQGFLKWHDHCPKDLVDCQKMYRKYL